MTTAVITQRGGQRMSVRFDILSVWNFLLATFVSIAAIVTGLALVRKDYIARLKESADGWKGIAEQARTQLTDAESRSSSMRAEILAMREEITATRREHDQVVQLNVNLQTELRAKERITSERDHLLANRDRTIAEQLTMLRDRDSRITALETQVEILKRQVAEISRGENIG